MTEKWNFLTDSYWYVPHKCLPALQMSAEAEEPTLMIDQTVWQITDYRYGYFWGNCVALIFADGTSPEDAPTNSRFVGTITPEGTVHLTFMPINALGAAISTVGLGKMKLDNEEWVFEMQMSTGITELTAHWSYMFQTEEGDASWDKLPGVDYSVPAFMEAAGVLVAQ